MNGQNIRYARPRLRRTRRWLDGIEGMHRRKSMSVFGTNASAAHGRI
jgi:hypothetical protein